jgi:hypothetical protein
VGERMTYEIDETCPGLVVVLFSDTRTRPSVVQPTTAPRSRIRRTVPRRTSTISGSFSTVSSSPSSSSCWTSRCRPSRENSGTWAPNRADTESSALTGRLFSVPAGRFLTTYRPPFW